MLEQANDPRKEAMRIQVAAVAAQQAALTEEEIKLNRRRAALEQQEAQLVAHLEEKRRRLIEVRDAAREARAVLQEERDAFEAHVKETMATLAEARAEAQSCKQQAQADRQRLRELRNRLKKRWHRHWTQERAALQRRRTELETIQGWLEAERARFQGDQNTLNRGRLWFNGEMELGRRQLQDGWNTLHQEQARWQQQRDAEDAAMQERARMLAEREQAVNIAVRELTEERRRWDRARLHLAGETEGLEARIANQRRKLLDHQTELALLPAIPPAAEITEVIEESINASESPARPLPLRHDLTSWLGALEKLSTELADQRVHLTEQCERLLLIQQSWHERRDHAAAEMEETSRLIQERDQALAQREQDLDDAMSRFAQRQADASYVHRYLESWQARLTARAAALEGEREREQAEIQGREDLANQRLAMLLQIGERWQERRREEVEYLLTEHEACRQLRHELTEARQQWLTRHAALAEAQRQVAQRLALLNRSVVSAEAENADEADSAHLLQFEKRISAISATAEKALAKEYRAMQTEAVRIEEWFNEVQEYGRKMLSLETEVTRRQRAWELGRRQMEEDHARLRLEVQQLHAQNHAFERQVTELADEVERLAQLLFEYSDTNDRPAVQAA